MPVPALEATQISKRFGTVRALDRVSVSFARGEIHAVLGENGAGKSTLMDVLSGRLSPDGGSVAINGVPENLKSPAHARMLGIAMVHQHFMLVPAFSVEENLALANLHNLASATPRRVLAERSLASAHELGWELDPRARTSELPVGVQQRTEIVKAVGSDASILIFDEPTAVLSPQEVQDLFRVLKALRGGGKAVILIAHKLSEVLSVADRVTVLRRGVKVAEAAIADVDERQLAEWMVGELPTPNVPLGASTKTPSLVVSDLVVTGDRGERAVNAISFSIAPGEILGFGGVDGNGQVELAEALSLVRKHSAGSLEWNREKLADTNATISYIPQDRREDGLALSMSIEDNLLIGGIGQRELSIGPFLISKRIRRWCIDLAHRFGVKMGSITDRVESLSGGNQQKIVVARTLSSQPDLLIAVNPTRGLDIQATGYVHEMILEAARAGAAVALFSTDIDELSALSSRTVFLSRGRIADILEPIALVGGGG
jgi:general nucleoside transport system ATP-binding protein